MYRKNEYRTQIFNGIRWKMSSGIMGHEKGEKVFGRQQREGKKVRLINITDIGARVVKV